jgi:hypothetical protein
LIAERAEEASPSKRTADKATRDFTVQTVPTSYRRVKAFNVYFLTGKAPRPAYAPRPFSK